MPQAVKAGDIFDRARFFLNDTDGNLFTDVAMLPALKIAIDDLRIEFEDANIPFTNVSSEVITVPAGVRSIGSNTETNSPALPVDLVEIIEIYERSSGTTIDFEMMGRRRFLPKTDIETAYLGVWSWQGQVVKLIGATGDIEVKIDYIGNTFNQIIDANTQIVVFNSIPFLSFRTAALAANYIGENKTRSDELNTEAQRTIDSVENIGIKSQQSMPIRRRPFRSRYKSRGYGW